LLRLPILYVSLFFFIFFIAVGTSAQSDSDLEWSIRQLSDDKGDAGPPAIISSQTGGIHIFWSQEGDKDLAGALYNARADGTGWSVNDIIVGDIQSPTVARENNGTMHVVWVEGNQLKHSHASVQNAVSAWAWTLPTTIADGPASYPTLIYDPRGILHLAFAVIDETSAIYYLQSSDGGWSWNESGFFETITPGAAAERPQIAISEDGTIHMVWSLVTTDSYYGGLGVYYTRSMDAGKSWIEPMRLDEEASYAIGEQAWLASIFVHGNREVHVVWDSHSNAGSRRHQWSRDGGLTWTSPEPIWGSFVSQTGPNPMITDSSETLYLFSSGTFDWNQRGGVYFSHWTGSNWGDPQLVNISSEGPHYCLVTVTEGNKLHVVWQARGSDPRSVWYASARTTAPYESTILFSELEEESAGLAPTLSPTDIQKSTLVSKSEPNQIWKIEEQASTNYQYLIMIGVVPVVMLIGVVVILKTVYSRHR